MSITITSMSPKKELEAARIIIKQQQEAIERIKDENKRLRFMIDNGLGWEDMITDCK